MAASYREAFGWFGEPWPSGACYDDDGNLRADMRKAFPAGESCLLCDEPFDEAAGDSGKAVPSPDGISHVHKECMMREVIGPLAHHEKRCHCYGRSEDDGTPGMTLREEAVEVWRRMRAGELYGRHPG